ncbi:HNH endonuclease signature motif containing protein [Maritalea porphyrae]|uniref:HNH endonuclease signature motif containing protein n=1 Tax=Maritalea porphyrae TaxID=880732 RepID=UPI0022AF3740|nr:HNH endonuclease signature motif containing protein [Maritalea porphyrae]MCZ4272956.1 HNH endonuclease signature motif containing protein [Maritalea porphyrae]
MFDQQNRQAIWRKAQPIPNYDPNIWRWDKFGNVIKYANYGLTTEHGWEYDHITPSSLGGGDEIPNLQPLHWRANRQKSNRFIG